MKKNMETSDLYFPLFFDLSKKKVVVIGSGKIGKRRIKTILPFVNEIFVVTKEIDQELEELLKEKGHAMEKEVEDADFLDADIVLIATDDQELNSSVYHTCKYHNILVNNCGNKEQCDFYFPGIVQKEEVVVGITASGKNHKKAREIRERIGRYL